MNSSRLFHAIVLVGSSIGAMSASGCNDDTQVSTQQDLSPTPLDMSVAVADLSGVDLNYCNDGGKTPLGYPCYI